MRPDPLPVQPVPLRAARRGQAAEEPARKGGGPAGTPHSLEDGVEAALPPQLSEALEADGIGLLESAEQLLAVLLQPRHRTHPPAAAAAPPHRTHAQPPHNTPHPPGRLRSFPRKRTPRYPRTPLREGAGPPRPWSASLVTEFCSVRPGDGCPSLTPTALEGEPGPRPAPGRSRGAAQREERDLGGKERPAGSVRQPPPCDSPREAGDAGGASAFPAEAPYLAGSPASCPACPGAAGSAEGRGGGGGLGSAAVRPCGRDAPPRSRTDVAPAKGFCRRRRGCPLPSAARRRWGAGLGGCEKSFLPPPFPPERARRAGDHPGSSPLELRSGAPPAPRMQGNT